MVDEEGRWVWDAEVVDDEEIERGVGREVVVDRAICLVARRDMVDEDDDEAAVEKAMTKTRNRCLLLR